jgi:hypothetical protein
VIWFVVANNGIGYGRIIWFIRVPRDDGSPHNLDMVLLPTCIYHSCSLLCLLGQWPFFLCFRLDMHSRNSTLNLESQDLTNNKFFLMFWYINNLGYVFYFFNFEFAIMLPFPSTLWLSPPIVVMAFLWDDLFKKIRRSLLFTIVYYMLVAPKSKY